VPKTDVFPHYLVAFFKMQPEVDKKQITVGSVERRFAALLQCGSHKNKERKKFNEV
jgi:hypothetical protein